MTDYWLWWWDSWLALLKSWRMPPRQPKRPAPPKQDHSFIGYGF